MPHADVQAQGPYAVVALMEEDAEVALGHATVTEAAITQGDSIQVE